MHNAHSPQMANNRVFFFFGLIRVRTHKTAHFTWKFDSKNRNKNHTHTFKQSTVLLSDSSSTIYFHHSFYDCDSLFCITIWITVLHSPFTNALFTRYGYSVNKLVNIFANENRLLIVFNELFFLFLFIVAAKRNVVLLVVLFLLLNKN